MTKKNPLKKVPQKKYKKRPPPLQLPSLSEEAIDPDLGGRPLLNITDEMVRRLAESMLPIEAMATLLGCTYETLYDRFSDTISKAREGRRAALSTTMWEKALIKQDTTMMIWMSKQHLGYRDKQPDEATQVHFNVITTEVPK